MIKKERTRRPTEGRLTPPENSVARNAASETFGVLARIGGESSDGWRRPNLVSLSIRACRLPEDVVALTGLLHRAYAELAQQGLKYVATHQTDEMTKLRARAGWCFVAELSGSIVGTITVRRSSSDAKVPVYREPGTFVFGQFGVDPDHRGKRVGARLHEHATRFAEEHGATAMALDTAAAAQRLIETYQRWGYRVVARHHWDMTNFESVIMQKELGRSNEPVQINAADAPGSAGSHSQD